MGWGGIESLRLGVKEQDHWPLPWSYTVGQERAPLDPCRKSCEKTEKAVLQSPNPDLGGKRSCREQIQAFVR